MRSESIEIPPRTTPADDNGYLEQLTKAVFRAGFNWQVIADKWPRFREAFDGFDIDTVAAYDDHDIERLLSDPGIVRNGRKVEATIYNARVMQEIISEHGSFHAYLQSLSGLPYAQKRSILSELFRNVGPTTVFVFLYSVNETVPSWEDRAR